MKFEFKGNEFLKLTMLIFKMVSSKKDIIVVGATPSYFQLILKQKGTTSVLGFSHSELEQMGYKCHEKGAITTLAGLLKGYLEACDADKMYYITSDKVYGGVIEDVAGEGVYYPLRKKDYEAPYKYKLPFETIFFDRRTFYDGLSRIFRAKISDHCQIRLKDNRLFIEAENNECEVQYSMKAAYPYQFENSILYLTLDAIFSLKKALISSKEERISLFMEDYKIWFQIGNQIVEYNDNIYKRYNEIEMPLKSGFCYQLVTDVKEWKYITKPTKRKDRVEYGKVVVNYHNGCYEYTAGIDRDLIRNPIDYMFNAHYYTKELLSTVPTEFSCSTKSLYSMYQVGRPKEQIAMYFGTHPEEMNMVLIDYNMGGKHETSLSCLFRAGNGRGKVNT